MVEVPEEQDFFAQQDDPHGFFDSLPDQPSADVTATAGFGAANSSSLLPTLSNGGALSEPPTPMADPNHVPEGAERVRGGGPAGTRLPPEAGGGDCWDQAATCLLAQLLPCVL
jgi:hypothetical protein